MVQNRAMVELAQGDLAGARRVLAAAAEEVDPAALAAYMGNYWDLAWALDDAGQRRLLGLGPAAFDGDRASWAWVLAQTHAFRGDAARARAYADTAQAAFAAQLRDAPADGQRYVLRGLALATAGRTAEGVREAERGAALLPLARDAFLGAYLQHQLARVHLLAGRPERALDLLEPLLKMPYYLSPGWLRTDPTFAPLRGTPRFERLAADR
jgi:tetratricopeptide (TPR) repeat protein